MKVQDKKAFYFHADASALGGVLTQPIERIISTHGSVSLAQAGGFSASHVERFDLDGLISFQAAHVTVSGSEHQDEEGWRTVTTAAIDYPNILNVVTADRIVAQISVMHFYDDFRPAEISFNGTQFVNLRLNGELPTLEMNDSLFSRAQDTKDRDNHPDYADSSLPRFSDLLAGADRLYRDAPEKEKTSRNLGSRFVISNPLDDLERKGTAVCSLVKGVDVKQPARSYAHQIFLPDFGNIFLGEMRVSPFSVQLTMLRVEMGCAASGNVSVGTAFSNGKTMP